jgi:hypothetical protein
MREAGPEVEGSGTVHAPSVKCCHVIMVQPPLHPHDTLAVPPNTKHPHCHRHGLTKFIATVAIPPMVTWKPAGGGWHGKHVQEEQLHPLMSHSENATVYPHVHD